MVFEGDKKRNENLQSLAYYQAYMAGVFSQTYEKNKFPKYGTGAPWGKSNAGRGDLAACLAAWDKVDRALSAGRR